jgi:hypothetical protein
MDRRKLTLRAVSRVVIRRGTGPLRDIAIFSESPLPVTSALAIST